ncbi:MAG: HD-GYP domain-containing protein [Rhodoferax sp.]
MSITTTPLTSPFATAHTSVASAAQVVLFAMATLAERRDADTEAHLLRVQGYVRLLAQALQGVPALAPVLTQEYVAQLVQGVLFYDIGTLAIPERILLKPGRFTPQERSAMQSHTVRGYQALLRAEKTCGPADDWLQMAKELALSHHEHWNGQGYPEKRAGEAIPLCARIVAVADVYDAMVSNKVYKSGMSHAQALERIAAERGAQFDPVVVDAFLSCADAIEQVALRYADTNEDLQLKMETLAEAIAEHSVM